MNKIISFLAIAALSGCTVIPAAGDKSYSFVSGTPAPGYVNGVVFAPFTRAVVYTPSKVVDYLGPEYYYYGQRVNILMPSMIYGYGWQGAGFYHARPYRVYDSFGQELPWNLPAK